LKSKESLEAATMTNKINHNWLFVLLTRSTRKRKSAAMKQMSTWIRCPIQHWQTINMMKRSH